MIHLTMTGAHAGLPGCALVRDGIPASGWGLGGYVMPAGDRGVHYAYAPEVMTSGAHPDVCPQCVAAFRDAS